MSEIYLEYFDEADSDSIDCMFGLLNETTNLMKFPFWNMVEYSFRDLLDMGDPEGCNSLPDANYIVLDNAVSRLPTSFMSGFCLTNACD